MKDIRIATIMMIDSMVMFIIEIFLKPKMIDLESMIQGGGALKIDEINTLQLHLFQWIKINENYMTYIGYNWFTILAVLIFISSILYIAMSPKMSKI
tara:strand:- start:48 stop:338 length:291 start_codon:yes stop_codon:yes gene_type:complete